MTLDCKESAENVVMNVIVWCCKKDKRRVSLLIPPLLSTKYTLA